MSGSGKSMLWQRDPWMSEKTTEHDNETDESRDEPGSRRQEVDGEGGLVNS